VLFVTLQALRERERWQRYFRDGIKAHEQGNYPQAEKLLKVALSKAKKSGTSPTQVATIMNNLAEAYREQAHYAEAEPLYSSAQAIEEKATGPGSRDLASALNHLALMYQKQHKYDMAEPLYKRSLSILEGGAGWKDTQFVKVVYNLSTLCMDRGRFADAGRFSGALYFCRKRPWGRTILR